MIVLDAVTKTYGETRPVTVLRGVSLRVEQGELVAIVGPSGSGKSTLLHLVGLLDRPTSGRIEFDGQDVAALADRELSATRGRRIGFVFQSFHLVRHLSALDNVALPLFYQGVAASVRREHARACLAAVKMEHRLTHRPSQLSGGECQRVAVARALVADPAVIMADEPTGNLDSRTGEEILDLLLGLHTSGRTIITITHDMDMAARMPRIVQMLDGRIDSDSGGGDASR